MKEWHMSCINSKVLKTCQQRKTTHRPIKCMGKLNGWMQLHWLCLQLMAKGLLVQILWRTIIITRFPHWYSLQDRNDFLIGALWSLMSLSLIFTVATICNTQQNFKTIEKSLDENLLSFKGLNYSFIYSANLLLCLNNKLYEDTLFKNVITIL